MAANFSQHAWLDKTVAGLSLTNILALAACARLVSAVFSTGYGMHDDHFNVIEVAQSWADGKNIGNWLPDAASGASPDISHSLFYPGIHFVLFCLMKRLGISDPQTKMLLVRILHAFYSLLTVYYSYKITEKVSNKTTAKWSALFISLLWFMPNLSVRNLVEMTCIPPLLIGTDLLIKTTGKLNWQNYLLSGFIIAFAFSIRYQTALFIGGIGMVLLLQKEFSGFAIYSAGVILNVLLVQCVADIILWGYPLAEFIGYVKFNMLHQGDFIQGYWFNYFLLITGLVLPPFSILLWMGYFINIKKRLLLFLPSFLFLVFHSFFKNKQERFILSFIPFFIIAGFAGWESVTTPIINSPRWKIIFRLFPAIIGLNMLLLVIASVSSSKTSRMNAMYHLYQNGDLRAYVIEASFAEGFQYFPRFYAGNWCEGFLVNRSWSAEQVKNSLSSGTPSPNYVIFLSRENLDARIDNFRKAYPHIVYDAAIEPGWMDRLFYKLNPVNKNEPCIIYKITE